MDKPIIVTLSGGKDSMAAMLLLIEQGAPIHSVVNVDVGWEFPWMYEHLRRVGKMLEDKGILFIQFKLAAKIKYLMFDHAVFGRENERKGKLQYCGKGWPSQGMRWCTREKNQLKDKYIKSIPGAVSCIGFAADEMHRTESKNLATQPYEKIYPLIDEGMTEADALAYCRKHGYFLVGESPYDHFNRVSCFCCPLQSIEALRILRTEYPEQWADMLKWDRRMPSVNIPFKGGLTVNEWDARFEYEESLFAEAI